MPGLGVDVPIDRVDEAFLLLALDRGGTFPDDVKERLDHGLAGAWLAELLVDGRLRMQDGKIHQRGHSPMDDPALDWVLERIRGRRPRPPSYWVSLLGRRAERYRPTILGRLEGRGVIERHEGPRSKEPRFPIKDPQRRESIVQQLRETLSGRTNEEPLLALLAVLDGADMLEHVFGAGMGEAYHNAVQGRLQRDHRLLALGRGIRRPYAWWLQLF
jgi:hypothetical protein